MMSTLVNGQYGKKMIRVCLNAAVKINRVFVAATACMQVLVLPQLSKFQRRVYLVWLLQLFSHDFMLVTVSKILQRYYYSQNFMLVLSLGSVLPFLRVVMNIWHLIPCPPVAATVSNTALVFALVVLLSLGASSYDSLWKVYAYVMMIWPWLVLASMVSRLYIERTAGKSPFSPIRDLPLLGAVSALAHVLQLLGVKGLSISDCIALTCLDPLLCALFGSLMLGKARANLHFRYVKIYALIGVLLMAYNMGDEVQGLKITPSHILFFVGRCLFVFRSFFTKWAYSRFYDSTVPPQPPETELMFYNNGAPRKHRFSRFPAPTLLTLDAIFDSGLRDVEYHGMGPLGTIDLYNLTEMAYLLPLASLMAFLYEQSTLSEGVFMPGKFAAEKTAREIVSDVNDDGVTAGSVQETIRFVDTAMVAGLLCLFVLARLLSPYAGSAALFDKGSSMHNWKYAPILLALPFFFLDVLYVNEELSKFQIVMFLLMFGVYAHGRDLLWTNFKRKYLLLCTQELQYHQPSCCRTLQRRTLLEFLSRTSTDDYGVMLMDTAIRHGANVRELARDTNIRVWDPAPTGTAAWKLAFSLVMKSLKRNNFKKKQKEAMRFEMHSWIERQVLSIVENAVDRAVGHGMRLRHAGALAAMFSKRRAVIQMQVLARKRRTLRQKRRNGQLSNAPMHLAMAGGRLRSTADFGFAQPPPDRFPQLPPPPENRGKVNPAAMAATATMSLNASTTGSFGGQQSTGRVTNGFGNTKSTMSATSLPGAMQGSPDGAAVGRTMSDEDDLPPVYEAQAPTLRGVWAVQQAASPDPSLTIPPGGSLVIAFGDGKRGQLGLDAEANKKHMASCSPIVVVEDLRGTDPVQVESSGIASFVVGGRGHLWAFGSNRQMELGLRKEVTQLNGVQRVKGLREHAIVQAASSTAASGQMHSMLLTHDGKVYTMGTSTRGALGQGPDVQQTAPIQLRITEEIPVRFVICGAQHSVIVTDEGRIFTFGDNSHGQLGLGDAKVKFKDVPQPLDKFTHQAGRCRLLAAGDNHCVAVTVTGRVYSWGANADGQLGTGKVGDAFEPQPILELPQEPNITSLACGTRHTVCVCRAGSQVWAWGSNVQGQLGVGAASYGEGQQRKVPSLVQTLSNKHNMVIVQVAAAACHTLALSRLGEVYAWGENAYGQLGFNAEGRGMPVASTANGLPGRTIREVDKPRAHIEGVARLWLPERVVSLSLWKIRAISTGVMHSLALAA
eukprot:TRINITY_DN20421_c0_g1_i1.p1 TRINITY_DN20421_c0_g1~~TRINITY_DN20421_c0_g1_i1.p1  ORF type:complete len:1234 (+),score=284.39 TRINITY_DN20421_c0_g1_i1:167-3868(+)